MRYAYSRMDYKAVYLFLCILVQLLYISECTLDMERKFMTEGQCHAYCYDQFGEKLARKDDIYYYYQQNVCLHGTCQKCLGVCNITYKDSDECRSMCWKNTTCTDICEFIDEIYFNNTTDSANRRKDSKSMSGDVISSPEIVCLNVPNDGTYCDRKIASVYIKWRVNFEIAPVTLLFIISRRERRSDGTASDWHFMKIVPNTFIQIEELACITWYQFRVTALTQDGVRGRSIVTQWTQTPGANNTLGPPLSIQVVNQSIINNKPTFTVEWDPGERAGCFYKIFWFGRKIFGEEEIKVPREFQYRINSDDIDFNTNYTVRLFSYDDQYRHDSGEEKHLYHVTPKCLESTAYNYTACAPLSPHNFSVIVTTPDHMDGSKLFVNVTLRWNPPMFTHNGRDLQRYELEYRKEPPINGAGRLQPHSDYKLIKPSDTSITLENIHNHNMYVFSILAVSIGHKKGPHVQIHKFIGLTEPAMDNTIANHTTIQKGRLTSLELLAIVLVPVVLIAALFMVVCVFMLKKRRKYRQYPPPRRFGPVEEMNPIYEEVVTREPVINGLPSKSDTYEIDYSCLDFISVIGEGAFGKVVKAEYYENPTERGKTEGRIVAVKMLKDFFTGDESRSFVLEINAMKSLGQHPFIVSIVGSCMTGPKLCLVMDYCALGDLRNYLRKYREKLMYNMPSNYDVMTTKPECGLTSGLTSQSSTNTDTTTTTSTTVSSPLLTTRQAVSLSNISSDINEDADDISEMQLLSYGRQITLAMEFLEQRKFIHRDLAARNILLYDHRHVKISDFGLTRDVYETNVYQPTSARKLPYKWMAIESLFSSRFTIKSDVWSFGIVLWEIVTLGGSPYPSIPLKDLYGLLNDGYRMEKPENCSTQLYKVMLSCWHPNPNHRPTFTQLKEELEQLLEETQPYIDLSIEVSEDYFKESAAESHTSECHMNKTRPNDGEEDKHCNEFIRTNLCVDIHDEPKKVDACPDSAMGKKTLTHTDETVEIVNCSNLELVDKNNGSVNDVNINTMLGSTDISCNRDLTVAKFDNKNNANIDITNCDSLTRTKPKLKDSLKNIFERVVSRKSAECSAKPHEQQPLQNVN